MSSSFFILDCGWLYMVLTEPEEKNKSNSHPNEFGTRKHTHTHMRNSAKRWHSLAEISMHINEISQIEIFCKLQLCVWVCNPLIVINLAIILSHMQFIIGRLQKFAHNKVCMCVSRPGKSVLYFICFGHICLYIAFICTNACTFGQSNMFVCMCGYRREHMCSYIVKKLTVFKSFSLWLVSVVNTFFHCLSLYSVTVVIQYTCIQFRVHLGVHRHTHTHWLLSVPNAHWIALFLSFVFNAFNLVFVSIFSFSLQQWLATASVKCLRQEMTQRKRRNAKVSGDDKDSESEWVKLDILKEKMSQKRKNNIWQI